MSKFATVALAGTIAVISQALGSLGTASVGPEVAGDARWRSGAAAGPTRVTRRPAIPEGEISGTKPAPAAPVPWTSAAAVTVTSPFAALSDGLRIGPATESVGSADLVSPRQGSRVEPSRALPFTITAYAQKRRGRVVSTARTASGTRPVVGRTVAVDPRIIPIGTRLHIEGIGERIAEDTGRLIKGRRIDLFVDSHEEGMQFGVRRGARVRIVALGDGRIDRETVAAD